LSQVNSNCEPIRMRYFRASRLSMFRRVMTGRHRNRKARIALEGVRHVRRVTERSCELSVWSRCAWGHCARRRGARVRQFLVGGFHRTPRAFAWSSIRASGARAGDRGGGRTLPKVFLRGLPASLEVPLARSQVQVPGLVLARLAGRRIRQRIPRGVRARVPLVSASPARPRARPSCARSGGDKTTVSGDPVGASAASI
jgi:hypothetical protein